MIWSGFVAFALLWIRALSSQDYTGYKLIRFPASKTDHKWLSQLEHNALEHSFNDRLMIDVLVEPSKYRPFADVLVAPELFTTFTNTLRENGVDQYKIVEDNAQRHIDREKREIYLHHSRRKRSLYSENADDFDINVFHSYHEMVDYMKKLAKQNPKLVDLLNITKTYEGRELFGVKIGKPGQFKPAIFIDAGIHAREWIAPAVALYMMHKLTTEYSFDPQITRMVDRFDWYIVPLANPDGYVYSQETDRLWRKTRSRNVTTNRWCVGVDANRNWGYRWGGAGANTNPCSNIYSGSKPFSEPEIAGIRDFITWQIPDLKMYVSLHSFGQVFLSPWGYTVAKPDNYHDQITAARLAVAAIKNETGAIYDYGTISNVLYPASGTSIDFMQNRGVPYIYGIELRPEDVDDNYAFALPARFIEPTSKDMMAAFKRMIEYIEAGKGRRY
ncbi:hypothetical protein QR680_001250 [Steinernema hermaphroditum]|uniref:Peptidase M14 domain-containing protein n=1 Tax=Steinernema hermaphroditum TaxID=289476 RepID=A0AA39GXH2_9BILA|nr:hypothetical protein QR680_001250 [Steinernema hermaphroditum]